MGLKRLSKGISTPPSPPGLGGVFIFYMGVSSTRFGVRLVQVVPRSLRRNTSSIADKALASAGDRVGSNSEN
ncbi:hypothetical protein R8510_01750 [Ralstonia chuxiongensis]|nr:hypothetical protein R8510_01750 [Ralstonia chuxiongensis]